MTSDGISTDEWAITHEYAAKIANAVCRDDESSAGDLTRKLFLHLDSLEARYGLVPSILATRADYTVDVNERIRLLEEAYDLAKRLGDRPNLTFIASSLADTLTEEAPNISSAEKWLSSLADALGDHWDDSEHQQFQRSTAALERLRQNSRNPAFNIVMGESLSVGLRPLPAVRPASGHLLHLLYWEGKTKPQQKRRKAKLT